jgi:hypothetical protein
MAKYYGHLGTTGFLVDLLLQMWVQNAIKKVTGKKPQPIAEATELFDSLMAA